jgi:hypothetical protein
MLNIGQFFKKIQNKYTEELFVRTIVKEQIQKYTGIVVEVQDISIKSGNIILKNVSQTGRSQIYIKKQALLEGINSAQQNKKIGDIR